MLRLLEVRIPEWELRRRGAYESGLRSLDSGFKMVETGIFPLGGRAPSAAAIGHFRSAVSPARMLRASLSFRLSPPALRPAHAVSCFVFLILLIKTFKCMLFRVYF